MANNTKPDLETLQSDPKYRLVLEIGFQDMIPFVMTNIRKKGVMSLIYITVIILMLVLILIQLVLGLLEHSLTWKVFLVQSITGILAGSILVIPLHEIIHGLAYKLLGAKKIIFGADLQQFIFFVTANRHPVSGSEIHFLALSPFITINLIASVLTLSFFPGILLFSSFFLLSHNLMCVGDFAVSNYIHRSENRIYSYDEPQEKKSYFYELMEDGPTPSQEGTSPSEPSLH